MKSIEHRLFIKHSIGMKSSCKSLENTRIPKTHRTCTFECEITSKTFATCKILFEIRNKRSTLLFNYKVCQ